MVSSFDKENSVQSKLKSEETALFTGTLEVNPNQSFCSLGMYKSERLTSLQNYCASTAALSPPHAQEGMASHKSYSAISN